jgi:hypothetical protein
LARKAPRNHINNSSPRLSIKSSHIIPNRESFETSVVLPCDKYITGVFVELDGTDGSPSEQFASEYSSTSAREKSQLIHIAFLFAFVFSASPKICKIFPPTPHHKKTYRSAYTPRKLL